MVATFAERIDVLRQMVGCPDKIVASCTVDQRYAQNQHEHLEYRHPRGGRALYLQSPLMENYHFWLEDYARTVLADGGLPAMRRAAEKLATQVEIHAPREFMDLMFSGHPAVTVGERTDYDRPAARGRLTPAELRAKSRRAMRDRWNAGLDVFWTRGGKVMHIPAGGHRKAWG